MEYSAWRAAMVNGKEELDKLFIEFLNAFSEEVLYAKTISVKETLEYKETYASYVKSNERTGKQYCYATSVVKSFEIVITIVYKYFYSS